MWKSRAQNLQLPSLTDLRVTEIADGEVLYRDGDFIRSQPAGGSGAPTNATYIVVSLDATLTNERRLQGTTNRITLTDGGAGADLVLDVGSSVYVAGGTDVAIADGGTGSSTASGARTNLGLAIGSDVQGYDAGLASLTAADAAAGLPYVTAANTWTSLTLAANKGIYATSASALATYDLTASGRALGGLTIAAGDLIQGTGAGTVAVLPAVATGNVPLSGGVGVVSSWGKVGLTTHVSGTLAVGNGGSGATTLTGVLLGNGASAFTALTGVVGAPLRGTGTGAAPAFPTNQWYMGPAKSAWSTGGAVTIETGIPAVDGDYHIILNFWVERVVPSATRRYGTFQIGTRRAAGTLSILATANEYGAAGGYAPTIAFAVSGDDITITVTSVGHSGYLSTWLAVSYAGDLTAP